MPAMVLKSVAPAPPRDASPDVSRASSLFDLLADYRIDGAPERVLPIAPP